MKKGDNVVYKLTGQKVPVTWVGNHTCFVLIDGEEKLVPHKDVEEK